MASKTLCISCRACGGHLRNDPLLAFSNMPKGAQNFPTREELDSDGGVSLELFQCPYCGVIQHNLPPVPYWRDVIRAVGISPEIRDFKRKQLRDFTLKHNLIGKYGAEIGCGDGTYLSILSETGMIVHGIENCSNAVDRCVAAGLAAYRGSVEEINNLPMSAYDAFFVFSYLEHVPDIKGFLDAVMHKLGENSVGLIEVPNFDMILHQGLFAEVVTDHIYYFTADTLKHTLESNGFVVLDCKPIWHDYIICAEVAVRPRLNISHFLTEEKRVSRHLAEYLKSRSRIVVWGAGHQSFTLLSLMGLAVKVSCIVDSAPFKQGRYSPVTHIPVVTPDVLKENPDQSVLIIGGSYSDEIAHLAREKYGVRDLAIFRNNRIEQHHPQ